MSSRRHWLLFVRNCPEKSLVVTGMILSKLTPQQVFAIGSSLDGKWVDIEVLNTDYTS